MTQQLPEFEREYIMVNQTDVEGFFIGMRILYVHHPSNCEHEFRACCIHRPSNHHMRNWPQLWRADKHLMERGCPHGVGHPDPDGIFERGAGIHGCDGCCHPPAPEVG